MQVYALGGTPARQRTACALVAVFENGELSPAARALDTATRGALKRVIERRDFHGRAGEVLPLLDLAGSPSPRVVLVGLGAARSLTRKSWRKAVAAALQWVLRSGAKDAVSYLGEVAIPGTDAYYATRATVETLRQSLYRIPDLKSGKKPAAPALAKLGIAVAGGDLAAAKRGIRDGEGLAAGTALSRNLANLPANVCTPRYLADTARNLAREYKTIRVRIHDEADIKRLKMGSFLSVTRGSEEPPRLIVIEYRGGRRGARPIALVGKGITFDTGGISLKDPPGMDEMKFDMTGAASVIGAVKAIAAIGAKVNVVAVVPTCENMPSGRATKPGDIVTSMSGKTIEVLNTDAEGRLILCDALTYVRRFEPTAVIDVATLTGACVIALGQHYCGLFSPDDELATALDAAGQRADDRAWRMPVAEEYADQLKSNFADLANVGGREGGAVTAACFLWKFTDGLRWAHLDIAGTAYQTGAAKGSTGRPVPLLVDWLLNQA